LSDGLAVVALLYRPKSPVALPTIVFNRGSYVRNGTAPEYLTTFHRLAAAGYVVLAPMYRGSAGAAGRDEMGGADLNDLLRIAALAEELPPVDAGRLFLLGESRGGMMVFQAIRDGFPALAAASYGAPPEFHRLFADAPEQYEPVADQLWPGWRADPEVLVRRSAMSWAEKIDVPLLLMHGGNDRSMPVFQSLAFAARLQELGKPVALHVLAYENHAVSGDAARRDKLIADWFGLHARGREKGRE
jgi:dipeptidyl aminopeptidase/acylaminoacyl peptidase